MKNLHGRQSVFLVLMNHSLQDSKTKKEKLIWGLLVRTQEHAGADSVQGSNQMTVCKATRTITNSLAIHSIRAVVQIEEGLSLTKAPIEGKTLSINTFKTPMYPRILLTLSWTPAMACSRLNSLDDRTEAPNNQYSSKESLSTCQVKQAFSWLWVSSTIMVQASLLDNPLEGKLLSHKLDKIALEEWLQFQQLQTYQENPSQKRKSRKSCR